MVLDDIEKDPVHGLNCRQLHKLHVVPPSFICTFNQSVSMSVTGYWLAWRGGRIHTDKEIRSPDDFASSI